MSDTVDDPALSPGLARMLDAGVGSQINTLAQDLRNQINDVFKGYLEPVHAAMKTFLTGYPEIEAVCWTTRGGEYNDNGYDGFGLRGPFFRIKEGETLKFTANYEVWNPTKRTMSQNIEMTRRSEEYWNSSQDGALDHWTGASSVFPSEILKAVGAYLETGSNMIFSEFGDEALLIWDNEKFWAFDGVDDGWDA